MINLSPFQVTVVLLAYNHEKWIRQAIDSVLMQEVDFGVEIVIVEDCSTDGTRAIVIEYAERYPDRLVLRLADRNRNSNVDWVHALRNARAPYVITLDGDDYWTSPHKLAIQVAFMNEHADCSLSYHNATCVNEVTGRSFKHNPHDEKGICTLDDLLKGNSITTLSAMASKRLIDPIPDWMESVKWNDWGLYLHASLCGTIRYFPDDLGVYRIHPGGAWWGLSEVKKAEGVIEFYRQMNANLAFRFDSIVQSQIAIQEAELARLRASP